MDRRADDGKPVTQSQLWTAYAFGHQQILVETIEPVIALAKRQLDVNPGDRTAQHMLQTALDTHSVIQQEIERLMMQAACAERDEVNYDLH